MYRAHLLGAWLLVVGAVLVVVGVALLSVPAALIVGGVAVGWVGRTLVDAAEGGDR